MSESTITDRGLIRSVVDRHARKHMLGYEEAHAQLLAKAQEPGRSDPKPSKPAKPGRTMTVRDRENGGTREIQEPPPLDGQLTPKGIAEQLFQECDRVDAMADRIIEEGARMKSYTALVAILFILTSIPARAQDLDRDGWVGFSDFLLFAQAYGQEAPTSRLEGVWISHQVTSEGKDVSFLFLVTASFVDGRFSMAIDSPFGSVWAQAGRHTVYSDRLTLRWGDGQRQTLTFERDGDQLVLTMGEFVFTLEPADVWASERTSMEEGRR